MFQVGYGYPVKSQNVSYDASVALATAVGANIHCVRLIATTDCHVVIAKTPVAAIGNMRLAAGEYEYFVIHPGEKVAAIKADAGTAGVLSVTEITR